jgi:hypothetical protein
MTGSVTGINCLEAWREAIRKITAEKQARHNLIVEITDPCQLNIAWLKDFNPRSVGKTHDLINDVINTIFPMRMAAHAANRTALYNAYMKLYRKGKRLPRNRSSWGTYFQRLVAFGDEGPKNQLEEIISKLKTWPRTEAALTLHLSAPNVDRLRRIGGPCWHFGEVIWHANGTLDLVVVYRNHDYFNKALGNFIGLGQLLNFICQQSGKTPGKLICHSVHVYMSTSSTQLLRLARI